MLFRQIFDPKLAQYASLNGTGHSVMYVNDAFENGATQQDAVEA